MRDFVNEEQELARAEDARGSPATSAPAIDQKCECSEEGVLAPGMAGWYDQTTELPFVKHAPNECRCTNEIALFERNGKRLWLCSCCHMTGDKRIDA